MDEIFGDFLGLNPMSEDEREAKGKELLGKVEVDHVIVDGKVYLGAEHLHSVLATFTEMLTLRAILLKDSNSLAAATGIETVREVLGELNSEFLKREVNKLFDL